MERDAAMSKREEYSLPAVGVAYLAKALKPLAVESVTGRAPTQDRPFIRVSWHTLLHAPFLGGTWRSLPRNHDPDVFRKRMSLNAMREFKFVPCEGQAASSH